MTSAHPPATTQVGFGHNNDWLWIGLTAILVAMVAGGVMWFITSPDDTATEALPQSVTGFEYDHEVTPIHLSEPGVTTPYLGYSGELWPAIQVLPAARGFDYDHEVTPFHIAEPGVTTQYFGFSGELWPAIQVLPAARGFDYDHEVTPMHLVEGRVTTEYYGYSGVLSDES